MNKTQMAKELAGKFEDLTQAGAAAIVDAVFDPTDGIIAAELADDSKVAIGGFGTFEARHRPARTARNPRTGEPIKVPARRLPAFKAAKALKDRLG